MIATSLRHRCRPVPALRRWLFRGLSLCGVLALTACSPGPDTRTAVQLYADGKVAEAMPILQLHASRKDPIANYFLAEMYLRGDGVEANAEKALNLLMAAAGRGLPRGRAALAALQSTDIRARNLPALLTTLNEVANQHPDAGLLPLCEVLHNLALGDDGDQYATEFTECAERLLEQDEASASRLQASWLVSGKAGDKDFAKSAELAERAVQGGDLRALSMLAASYAEGLGRPRDFRQAYAYANAALALAGPQMSPARRSSMETIQKRALKSLSQNEARLAEAQARKIRDEAVNANQEWNLTYRFGWALASQAN